MGQEAFEPVLGGQQPLPIQLPREIQTTQHGV